MSQPTDPSLLSGKRAYQGGCHCGAVRFSADIDLGKGASRCNCSVCLKTGVTSTMIKPADFTLLSGQDHLQTYEWGYRISQRFFCKACGVHSFARGHLEEVGGDYVSVNVSCLDDIEPTAIKVVHWDGRHDNWEQGPRDTPWPVHAAV